jgi:hypothetical protein
MYLYQYIPIHMYVLVCIRSPTFTSLPSSFPKRAETSVLPIKKGLKLATAACLSYFRECSNAYGRRVWPLRSLLPLAFPTFENAATQQCLRQACLAAQVRARRLHPTGIGSAERRISSGTAGMAGINRNHSRYGIQPFSYRSTGWYEVFRSFRPVPERNL